MNAWAKLVQKTYNANKHKTGYKLKNAMKDSKKLYKTMKKRGGVPDLNEGTSVVADAAAPKPVADAAAPKPVADAAAPKPVADAAAPEVAVGGKKKSKKNKSAKKSRKNRK
jgi:hypothetical protein